MSAREPLADRERPRGGALRATFRMLCCPFRAYRGCGSVVGDPMTDAHGLVRLYVARITCNCASPKRRVRRRALRIVTVPPAAPERSAGYDASLGCPGAGPLLPGPPAMCRNSVTEAQLHRAVARRARGVPSHGQHLWTHRQTSFPTHYRLRRNGRGAPQAAKRLLLGSLSGRMYTA